MDASLRSEDRPSLAVSVVLFVVSVALMAWLRLVLFNDRFLVLTYGLPLLLCLWQRDRALLWGMAGTFALMSSFKAWYLLPPTGIDGSWIRLQWLMQLANIFIVALTVHVVIGLDRRLREKNARLEKAHEEIRRQADELEVQAEELAQQNEESQEQGEELRVQGEELAQQNEDLQHQREELERQSEELALRSEELRSANEELSLRERVLQATLRLVGSAHEEGELLHRICGTLVALIGEPGEAACVLEAADGRLVVKAGPDGIAGTRWPKESSFAALVMDEGRTAYVDDLSARPDLLVPHTDGRVRSVLGTPLRLNGDTRGAIEVYSSRPHQWTARQFRTLEWVAGECSLALQTARLREELERANSILEKTVSERTGRLRETVDELEHFSYTITHDMRAPLRAMQGFAGLMRELCADCLTPERNDCLDRIETSAARMDTLITDALAYSRTLQQELPLSVIDPAALLRGIIRSYPALQPPRARIELDGAFPPVRANEAGLTQCFSNILSNAVKFVEPGRAPRVRIRAVPGPGRVRIWFEDNGIGISDQMKPRLFQMFQRASKDYEGTGVGLALVKKVAERMGGTVGVESEPGKGSRFWLELQS